MAYCTQGDLETRYGQSLLEQLSDRDGLSAGTIDAALVARAIADAAALADSYLASRYLTPLDPVPAVVTDIVARIAIYYAHGQAVTDKIKADHEAALRQLKDVANGVMTLASAGLEAAGGGANEVMTAPREGVFTPETMKGFI